MKPSIPLCKRLAEPLLVPATKPLVCCAMLILGLIALVSSAHAQTNVRAWHAKGQTWVVWDAGASPNYAYSVYRSASAFAATAQATIEYWKNINGCTGGSVKKEFADQDPNDGCRVRSERWEGKALVLFYTLEGHGRGFPMQKGFADADTGPKTRDISAQEGFGKFFTAPAK
jgi:poly(3-hydroxybutyrate) depolymerase